MRILDMIYENYNDGAYFRFLSSCYLQKIEARSMTKKDLFDNC